MRRCNSTTRSISRIRAGGFTLMELMITVALAGILLGFAIPSFRTMMANNRLTTQTNEFVGAVTFARSEAITRNNAITLCRADAVGDDECAPDDEPWSAWIVMDEAGEVLRNGEIDNFNNSLLVTSDLVNQSLEFRADGLARTGGGLVADNTISVCVTRNIEVNFRIVTIGAGSRLSTSKDSGDCE